MPLRRLFAVATFARVLLLPLFLAFHAPIAHAALGLDEQHVKASLVAAETSVQPGRPLTVALRLEHEEHWHTYWINPGTGYPTSLKWNLPTGWTASEFIWPTPVVIKDSKGNVTGNGYEGIVYLPLTLTPPATLKPGDTITLVAHADWLMCADVCVPGSAQLSLSLRVTVDTPKENPVYTAERAASAFQPPTPGAGSAQLSADGKTVTLTVPAPADKSLTLADPWFFAADGFIQYDQPQKKSAPASAASASSIVLTLPVSSSVDAATTRLTGILAFRSANKHHGLTLDIPLERATASSASSTLNPLPSSDSSAGSAAPGGFLGTLLFAFVGGLILNLMPCVFPVLGIKILGFVNQSGSDRRKVTLHGIAFTVGVLLSFWSLAALLAILRAGGDELGWGFQLQSAPFVFVLAAVILVFALSMSGVFEFGLRATGVGASLQSKSGYSGSFFTGVLATVVATPCSAPFLAPALGAALALPTGQSFIVFTAIAVGLALPYLLLSIFPQAVKALPRPGAWMETFKQVMAFPLYATVAALVWVLAGQATEAGLLLSLFGLVLIAMAAWLYGRYTAPGAKPARVRFGIIGGLALLVAGTALGWPRPAAPTDIVWEKWSPAAVAEAQAAGKTVYVDFTARWCATCQTNKKIVFSSDDVKRTFREKGVVTLKADWTNKDPQITTELAKFGRSAVPFNLVYKPGTAEPLALPELLTPTTVLEAVKS